MKKLALWWSLGLAAAVLVAGCGGGKINTAKLEQGFAAAEAPVKTDVQKAVELIKAQDYAGAVAQLQKVAARAKLTPEQRQVIKETIELVQQKIAEGANKSVEKAAEKANKTLDDLKK